MANREISQAERGSMSRSASELQAAAGQLDRARCEAWWVNRRLEMLRQPLQSPGGFSMMRSNMMYSGQSRPPGWH